MLGRWRIMTIREKAAAMATRGGELVPGEKGGRKIGEPGGAEAAEEGDQGGEDDRGGNGCEGDVAVDEEHEDEKGPGGQAGEGIPGPKSQHGAEPGGDAFAALEFQPNGEEVADDGGGAGEERGPHGEGGGGITLGVQMMNQHGGDEDGEEAFGGIEEEGLPEVFFAQDAAEIGGTDVFGALGPDIHAVGFADDESERDGAGEVGKEWQEEEHQELVEGHGGSGDQEIEGLSSHPDGELSRA